MFVGEVSISTRVIRRTFESDIFNLKETEFMGWYGCDTAGAKGHRGTSYLRSLSQPGLTGSIECNRMDHSHGVNIFSRPVEK